MAAQGRRRGGASLKIQGGASLYMQVIKRAAQMRVRSDVTQAKLADYAFTYVQTRSGETG